MPLLPMTTLAEGEACVAVHLVLVEPEPAKEDARARLKPGFERLVLEDHARYRQERGEIDIAKYAALAAVSAPSLVPAVKAWERAWCDVQTVAQLTWFLIEAVRRSDERRVNLKSASEAFAARAPLNQNRGTKGGASVYLQRIFRQYRPAAHIAAAFWAFKKDARTGYLDMLQFAGWNPRDTKPTAKVCGGVTP